MEPPVSDCERLGMLIEISRRKEHQCEREIRWGSFTPSLFSNFGNRLSGASKLHREGHADAGKGPQTSYGTAFREPAAYSESSRGTICAESSGIAWNW
jgi:hypothetical protein